MSTLAAVLDDHILASATLVSLFLRSNAFAKNLGESLPVAFSGLKNNPTPGTDWHHRYFSLPQWLGETKTKNCLLQRGRRVPNIMQTTVYRGGSGEYLGVPFESSGDRCSTWTSRPCSCVQVVEKSIPTWCVMGSVLVFCLFVKHLRGLFDNLIVPLQARTL